MVSRVEAEVLALQTEIATTIEASHAEIRDMWELAARVSFYYSRLMDFFAKSLELPYPGILKVPFGVGAVRAIQPLQVLLNPKIAHCDGYDPELQCAIRTGGTGIGALMHKGANPIYAFIPIDRSTGEVLMMRKGDCFQVIEQGYGNIVFNGKEFVNVCRSHGWETRQVFKHRDSQVYDSFADSKYNTNDAWYFYKGIFVVLCDKEKLPDNEQMIWCILSDAVKEKLPGHQKNQVLRQLNQVEVYQAAESEIGSAAELDELIIEEERTIRNEPCEEKSESLSWEEQKVKLVQRKKTLGGERHKYYADHREWLSLDYNYYANMTLYLATILRIPFPDVLNVPLKNGWIRRILPLERYQNPGIATLPNHSSLPRCPIVTGIDTVDTRMLPKENYLKIWFPLQRTAEGGLKVLMSVIGSERSFIETGYGVEEPLNRANRELQRILMPLEAQVVFQHSDAEPYRSLANSRWNSDTGWYRYQEMKVVWIQPQQLRSLKERFQWQEVDGNVFKGLLLRQQYIVWEVFATIVQEHRGAIHG